MKGRWIDWDKEDFDFWEWMDERLENRERYLNKSTAEEDSALKARALAALAQKEAPPPEHPKNFRSEEEVKKLRKLIMAKLCSRPCTTREFFLLHRHAFRFPSEKAMQTFITRHCRDKAMYYRSGKAWRLKDVDKQGSEVRGRSELCVV